MNPVYLVMIGVCVISSLTMFLHMRDSSVLSPKSKRNLQAGRIGKLKTVLALTVSFQLSTVGIR